MKTYNAIIAGLIVLILSVTSYFVIDYLNRPKVYTYQDMVVVQTKDKIKVINFKRDTVSFKNTFSDFDDTTTTTTETITAKTTTISP